MPDEQPIDISSSEEDVCEEEIVYFVVGVLCRKMPRNIAFWSWRTKYRTHWMTLAENVSFAQTGVPPKSIFESYFMYRMQHGFLDRSSARLRVMCFC